MHSLSLSLSELMGGRETADTPRPARPVQRSKGRPAPGRRPRQAQRLALHHFRHLLARPSQRSVCRLTCVPDQAGRRAAAPRDPQQRCTVIGVDRSRASRARIQTDAPL